MTATTTTAGGHAALADYWCDQMSRQEFALLMITAGYSDGPTATQAWDEAKARRNGSTTTDGEVTR